jgi:pimeloyl-ACP methyl ester carboxylesterase
MDMPMTPSAQTGPTSHFFMSQRLRLHYVDWGNPGAPPLLLLHGARDHCRNWDWIARELRHDWHIIAPDLRGHGDSAHSQDGNYIIEAMVYDLAQLIHRQGLAPLSIVAHSLGGNIAIRYAGLYPDTVRRLVAIEGLGRSPEQEAKLAAVPMADRLIRWIDARRALSGRQPRRYASIDEALERMMAENKRLSPDRARHLTIHGVNQNEDGSYSWKFDNYLRGFSPVDMTTGDMRALWARVSCDVLMVYGRQSWASNPVDDGRLAHFPNARLSLYDDAGHWVHHDRHDAFVAELRAFLA